MSAGPHFIDVEGFQHGDGEFIIKEMAVLNVDTPLRPVYFLFKSPVRWGSQSSDAQRTFRYQEENVHHLSWHEGQTRFCKKCVMHHIKKHFRIDCIFFVLGEQKLRWLQTTFRKLRFSLYNGITMSRLPLAPTNVRCVYRDHDDQHCAVLKCYRMYDHFITNMI